MGTTFRLLDTGVRTAAENMAYDEALLLSRSRGESPDTLRFLRFSPPAALAGYHQCLSEVVRLDFCRERGIDWNRRITGGGAIFFDESQLGWEVIATTEGVFRGFSFEALTEKIAEGLIKGLRRWPGIEAQFRPRNDIEVGGRKCSGTGGAWKGDAFLFQGTLLVDFDADLMLRALRVPVEKLKAREIASLRDRVTCLRDLLGGVPPLEEITRFLVEGFEEALGVTCVPGGLTQGEEELFRRTLPLMRSGEWIDRVQRAAGGSLTASHSSRSGLLRAELALAPTRRTIQNAYLTGDIFCRPARALYDLEAALKGCRLDEDRISKVIDDFFAAGKMEIPYGGPADVKEVFRVALDRLELVGQGFTLSEANSLFCVGLPFREVMRSPLSLVLLPYCAKDRECGYRQRKDCLACGGCSAGAIYDAAGARGIPVTTIVSYEDLERTLRAARAEGVAAFVGSCCEAFYHKHREDFERLGVPGMLVDIDSVTCYDLGKSRDAYRGDFEAVTRLHTGLIAKVIDRFPCAAT